MCRTLCAASAGKPMGLKTLLTTGHRLGPRTNGNDLNTPVFLQPTNNAIRKRTCLRSARTFGKSQRDLISWQPQVPGGHSLSVFPQHAEIDSRASALPLMAVISDGIKFTFCVATIVQEDHIVCSGTR